jgi:hypothetical protein
MNNKGMIKIANNHNIYKALTTFFSGNSVLLSEFYDHAVTIASGSKHKVYSFEDIINEHLIHFIMDESLNGVSDSMVRELYINLFDLSMFLTSTVVKLDTKNIYVYDVKPSYIILNYKEGN